MNPSRSWKPANPYELGSGKIPRAAQLLHLTRAFTAEQKESFEDMDADATENGFEGKPSTDADMLNWQVIFNYVTNFKACFLLLSPF